jgi:hypothetical protein
MVNINSVESLWTTTQCPFSLDQRVIRRTPHPTDTPEDVGVFTERGVSDSFTMVVQHQGINQSDVEVLNSKSLIDLS